MKRHHLIGALVGFKGNPRGCVYAEPIWGVPYNLYYPYASVFMVALGLADRQIGLIMSLSFALQVVFSLASGAITDKLGRRWTTLIFDIIAWGGSALISALARDFWWFLAAGMVNSIWRVTQNSWTCLLVEDANPDDLGDIYAWIYIANQVVGFAAPLAGLLIARFDLEATVRGLYFFAAVMFTLKAVVTFLSTKETAQGEIRREETRGKSFLSIIGGYGGIVKAILASPRTLYVGALMLVISITQMISGTFFAILATQKLGIPADRLSAFPFIRSAVVIGIFFLASKALSKLRFRPPLIAGFALYAASQLVYVFAPAGGYGFLVAGTVLEGISFAVANPMVDRLLAVSVDPKERARIQSLLYVGVIILTAPFGWIAGSLSQADRALPLVLNAVLYGLGAVAACFAGRKAEA